MRIDKESGYVDFLKCGEKFRKKSAVRPFAETVVLLAVDLVQPHKSPAELRGIRDTIGWILQRSEWNVGYFFLPVKRSLKAAPGESVFHLADSLIATVLNYRGSLDETVSGLRSILLSDIVYGLEFTISFLERNGCSSHESLPEISRESEVGKCTQINK